MGCFLKGLIMKFPHTMQSSNTDCGLAVIITILKSHHISAKQFYNLYKTISPSLNIDMSTGLSLLDIKKILLKYKIESDCYRIDKHSEFLNIKFPCIARISENGMPHYVVIHKMNSLALIISNPANDTITEISSTKFQEIFLGEIVAITTSIRRRFIFSVFSLFYRVQSEALFKRHIKSISIISKLILIVSVSNVFFIPILLTHIISQVINNQKHYLNINTALFLTFLSFLLCFIFKLSVNKLKETRLRLVHSIQEEMVLNLLHFNIVNIYSKKDINQMSAFFWNIIIAAQGSVDKLFLSLEAIYLIFLLALITLYSPILTLLIIIWIIIISVIVFKKNKHICNTFTENTHFGNNYASSFVQLVQTSFDLNAFNKVKQADAWFQRQMYHYFNSNKKYVTAQTNLQIQIQFTIISMLLILAVIYLYCYSNNSLKWVSNIETGIYILFIIISSITKIIQDYINFSQSKATIEYVNINSKILHDTMIPSIKTPKIKKINLKINSFIYKNTDSHINLKYPRHVFKTQNLNIILGETGSGKSTLLKLLAGLHKLNANSILIIDEDKNEHIAEQNNLKQITTLYSPEMDVYEQTLQKNILFNFFDKDNESSIDQKRNYKKFKSLLRLELSDTFLISPNGTNVSQGQRQKILILRTLLSPNSIYLLDEPTSHLDEKSKQGLKQIFDILQKEHKLIIIVTHDTFFNRYASHNLHLK